MDITFDTYQRGSFRGVEFLYNANKQSGGRKNAKFEYPNRDTRYMQDLGRLPRIYKMTVVITRNDDTFFTARDAFIEALEDAGVGILVHPIEGTKRVFLGEPYVVDDSMKHINVSYFHVTFYETGEQIYPTTSPSNAASIAQQINSFVTQVNEDFTQIWQTIARYQGSVNYSLNLIQNMINEFTFALSVSTTNQSAANQYQADLNAFTLNKTKSVFNATLLSGYVNDLFFDLGTLNSDSESLYQINESFFAYSPDDPIDQTTVSLEQQEKNRISTNQIINTYALAYAYLFTTQTQFDNAQDIQTRNVALNNQFKQVVLNNLYVDIQGDQFQVLSRDTLSTLETLRFNAHDYLRRQLANARTVVAINVPRASFLTLVYAYYDSLELYDDIASLNNVVNPTGITGAFNILSTEGVQT